MFNISPDLKDKNKKSNKIKYFINKMEMFQNKKPLWSVDGKVIYKGKRGVEFKFTPPEFLDINGVNVYFQFSKCEKNMELCPTVIFQNWPTVHFSFSKNKEYTFAKASMDIDRFNFEEFDTFETPLKVFVYEFDGKDVIDNKFIELFGLSPLEKENLFFKQMDEELSDYDFVADMEKHMCFDQKVLESFENYVYEKPTVTMTSFPRE